MRSLLLSVCASLVLVAPRLARAQEPPPAAPPAVSPQAPAPAEDVAAAPAPVVAAPAPVDAADPTEHLHDGFYFRAGLGAGVVAAHRDDGVSATTDHGVGAALWLGIGGTPAPGLVVGGLVHVVAADDDRTGHDVSISNVGLGPFVDWYPDPRGGWHVGGFLGFGGGTLQRRGDDQALASTALGGAAFGGYDWWIGPQWSLGVMGVLAGATSARLARDGEPTKTTFAPVSFAVDAVLLFH